jgi:hypothetical protein
MTKLAEKLRVWEESEENFSAARAALVDTPADAWDDDMRSCYLRGHDDAMKECAKDGTGGRDTYELLWSAIDEMGKAAGADVGTGSNCNKTADAVVKKIATLTAEVEKWKGRYYDVADAVTSESTGVEDLCRQARQTRETCDALTARVRELEAEAAAVGVVGSVRWGVLEVGDHMISRVWDKRDGAEHYRHSYPQTGRVVAIVDPAQIVPLASANAEAWKDRFGVWHEYKDEAEAHGPVTPLYPGLAQPAQEREG